MFSSSFPKAVPSPITAFLDTFVYTYEGYTEVTLTSGISALSVYANRSSANLLATYIVRTGIGINPAIEFVKII